MYLHIGNGESVKEKEVIGIFDLDTSTVSSITKKYISENQKMGLVEYSDSDIPRAFVLVEEKKEKYKIKLSRISTTGLKLRAENKESLE